MAAIMEGTRYAAGRYRNANSYVDESFVAPEPVIIKPKAPVSSNTKADFKKYAIIGLLILGAMVAINKFGA